MSTATTALALQRTDPLVRTLSRDEYSGINCDFRSSMARSWTGLPRCLIHSNLYTIWYLKTDNKPLVALVYFVFAVEIAETGLVTHAVRQLLSVEWGNVVALASPLSSFTARAIPVSLVTTIVQLYFSWRIHALGRRLLFTILGVLVALISIAQCSTGIAFGVLYAEHRMQFLDLKSVSATKQLRKVQTLIGQLDLVGYRAPLRYIIAGVFSYLLWTFKGNMLNESVLVPVVSRTMQSSVLAALASLCHVAFFVKAPIAYSNITVIYLVGKLYSNILLVDLNRRQRGHNSGNSYMDLDPMSTRAPSPMSQREAGTLRAFAGPRSDALGDGVDVIHPFIGGMPANPPADPEVTSITSTSLGPPPTYQLDSCHPGGSANLRIEHQCGTLW
ncbi:hypothetical protein BDZ89DRAFT_1134519 [Hymenopellis radicata]|nr:hypothetical protein BDZ89DRAFT_1134519 [Hymenopellis radicata]